MNYNLNYNMNYFYMNYVVHIEYELHSMFDSRTMVWQAAAAGCRLATACYWWC